MDLEGASGSRQVRHRAHRAEPAAAGRGLERPGRGVLPVPDEVHGGPAAAARDQRSQMRLHYTHGKIRVSRSDGTENESAKARRVLRQSNDEIVYRVLYIRSTVTSTSSCATKFTAS